MFPSQTAGYDETMKGNKTIVEAKKATFSVEGDSNAFTVRQYRCLWTVFVFYPDADALLMPETRLLLLCDAPRDKPAYLTLYGAGTVQ